MIKDTLRVIQWNAECLSTKMYKLQARILEDEIDVCLVQETHLREKDQTPYIEGYKRDTELCEEISGCGGAGRCSR